jgi:hypothetical protein
MSILHVAAREYAPTQNCRAHCFRIIGSDTHRVHSESAFARRRLLTIDADGLPPPDTTQRELTCQTSRFDSGDGFGSLHQLSIERFSTGLGIAEARQIEARTEAITGLESQINGSRMQKAARTESAPERVKVNKWRPDRQRVNFANVIYDHARPSTRLSEISLNQFWLRRISSFRWCITHTATPPSDPPAPPAAPESSRPAKRQSSTTMEPP